MKSLISFIALIGLASCVSIGLKDSTLDPGRIMWPKETWVNNPIQVSQTNAGATVYFTFTFRTSTALTNGILEVDLPSTLSSSPLYSSSTSFAANQDKSVTISTSITLPSSAGAYGPFALITRSSSTGQIYDANYVFGCIATSSSVSSSATLTVTNAATSPIVGSTDTLYFAFSLSQSLWKYDIFEIVLEPTYSISAGTTCASATVTGVTNILYGPDSTNQYNLPCAPAGKSSSTAGPQTVSSSTNSVYIYGLAQDVYVSGSLSVKLSVGTFTYPGYQQPSSSNNWKVNIWRWGTNTLLASYTATSGPITPTVGTVTASWAPISTITASEVISGMTIFTKLTFTTTHDIPKNGVATITLSNADPYNSIWWQEADGSGPSTKNCLITPAITGAVCTVASSTSVTISFGSVQKAGSFSIALLLTLTTGAKISSVLTTYSSMSIDSGSTLASWTFSTSNTAFTEFKFHAFPDATANDYPTGGTLTTGYQDGANTANDLLWVFKETTWTASTTIAITLPQSSSLSYTLPYIGSGWAAYKADSDLTADAPFSAVTVNTVTQTSNTINVSFGSAVTGPYYILAFTGATTALPYVASNLGTFYETYAIATTSPAKQIGSYVYSVIVKDYGGTGIFAKPLCKSNKGSGIPIIVAFYATNMGIDFTSSTNTFVLEIQLAGGADLGTGIDAGSTLPSSSTVSTVTANLANTDTDALVKITGLGSLSASGSASPVNIFLSTGTYPTTTFASVTAVYYTTSSDSSIKNYLFQSKITSITLLNTAVSLSQGSSTSTWTISNSGTLSSTNVQASALTGTGSYYGIGLPTGFTVSSPVLTVAGTSPTTTYSASSAGDLKNGGFVIGINGSASYAIGTGDTTLSLSGISAPGYSGGSSGTSNTVTFTTFVATTTPGATCTVDDITHLTGTVTIGIPTVSCSASSLSAAGPDSVDSTMTLTVGTATSIPAGGSIVITLANWSFTSSTCSVSGLSDKDKDNAVRCQISTNTLTIDHFAAFSAGSITITIPHVLPPSTASDYKCLTDISTLDSEGNYIDYTSTISQTLTVTAAASSGSTSSITATAYPNFAGAVGADIYLKFALSKALPAGSIIDITPGFASWSRSTGDIKDYCWASIDYTSCTITSSKVEITITNSILATTDIQVYLDAALTLPSTAGATSSGWQITSSWKGTTITTDATGASFTVNAAVSSAITITSIKMSDINNAAEAATYAFSFASAVAVASGDYFVIQFPRGFDAYIGDAMNTYPDCLPYTWYLGCSSTALGSVSCTADHWYLLVSSPSKTVTASSAIDLSVQAVRNPAEGTTGSFNIYHYKSDGTVKAFATSSTTVTTKALALSSIILKDVMSDSTQLITSSKYTFDFYVPATTYTSDNKIVITFPEQYNHQLYIGSSGTASCSTTYYEESNASGTDHTKALSWITVSSCSVSGQQITLALPTGTSQAFTTSQRVQVVLSSINNPQWGLDRPSSDKGWDNMYTKPYGDYAYWTSRFGVAITSTTNTAISYKSYGVLNSAYLGFALSTTSVQIGSYSPDSKNGKIQITPGTQTSDITITLDSTWPLASRSVKLTYQSNANYPDNSNLKYSSAHYNWMIYQMYPSLTFRVAALTGTAQGIYYIDWGVTETPQTGLSARYSAPLSTMVEVCTLSQATISIATIPSLNAGSKSIPIAVTLSNAPASDLTITPSFGTTTTAISINPTSLTFKPDVNVLYFQLVVSSSYTTASPSLSFTLSGTDKDSFSAPASKSVTVSTTASTATAAIVTLSSSVKSVNEVVVTASCSQNIVLYWSLTCKGSATPTFSELIGMTADLISKGSGTYYLQEQLDADYFATETVPDYTKGDTDIQSFFRRMHKEHCASPWTSSQVIYTGSSASIDLNWLMGGTDYVFTAYAVNEVTNNTTPVTTSFSTTALPSVSTYTVSFAGSVAQSTGDSIKLSIAKNMGINPAWLTGQTYATTATRFLADGTTTFTYNVLYDRSKGYTPANIITSADTTTLTSELTTLTSLSPTLTSGTASTGTTPTWTVSPAESTVGETTATFTATSSQTGYICVSCTESVITGKNVYAWQVIDGLDGNSEVAYGSCNNSTAAASTTLTVSGLSSGTDYYCYFTACNSYPLWPTCIDYTSTLSLVSVKITTDTTDSSAMILGAIAGLLLIFN